jgi:preprotein translocase subunit SecE
MIIKDKKIKKVISFTRQALKELKEEMQRHELGIGKVSSLPQLKKMYNFFDDILKELESGKIPPKEMRNRGVGKVIIDSWPFESLLGKILLNAEQAYLKLPNGDFGA